MSLVEKPLPKDLVGLHMSFGVVPPLVRLRGAELLEVMAKAAERSKSTAEMNNTPLLPSQPKSIPTHTVFDQEPVIAADLWSFSKGDSFFFSTPQFILLNAAIGGHQPLVRTTKSSLFGVRPTPTPKISVTLGTKSSSLFLKPGQLSKRHPPIPQKSGVSDIMSKVHEGILKSSKVNAFDTNEYAISC